MLIKIIIDFSYKISWRYLICKLIHQRKNVLQLMLTKNGNVCLPNTIINSSQFQYSPYNLCMIHGQFLIFSDYIAKMDHLSNHVIPLKWILLKNITLVPQLSWSKLAKTKKVDIGLQLAPTMSTAQVEHTKTMLLKCQQIA